MVHPEIQRRAHEEIDRVTGGYRLPTLEECVPSVPPSATSQRHHDRYAETRNSHAVLFVATRLNYNRSKDLLPYINALIQELLRWGAVVPLAVPHKLIQDNEYRGGLCDFY
jgi:cytochrome P450